MAATFSGLARSPTSLGRPLRRSSYAAYGALLNERIPMGLHLGPGRNVFHMVSRWTSRRGSARTRIWGGGRSGGLCHGCLRSRLDPMRPRSNGRLKLGAEVERGLRQAR
ncbi:hypothetical protein NL676_028600 [Syzygium grande]|nr:hypothetical protein NL676_028600 [Syzygium grande]